MARLEDSQDWADQNLQMPVLPRRKNVAVVIRFFLAKSMQSGPKQQTTVVEGWSRSNLRCILAWSRAWSHMSGKSASIRLKPDLRHFWVKPWKTLNKKMFYQSPILDSMYQFCGGSVQRFHTKCGELNPVVPAYALIIKREMLRGYYLLTPNTQTMQRFIPPFVQNNLASQDSSESKLYQAEVVQGFLSTGKLPNSLQLGLPHPTWLIHHDIDPPHSNPEVSVARDMSSLLSLSSR